MRDEYLNHRRQSLKRDKASFNHKSNIRTPIIKRPIINVNVLQGVAWKKLGARDFRNLSCQGRTWLQLYQRHAGYKLPLVRDSTTGQFKRASPVSLSFFVVYKNFQCTTILPIFIFAEAKEFGAMNFVGNKKWKRFLMRQPCWM